jgi:hypothetical protein
MPVPDYPQVYGAPPTIEGSHLRDYAVGPTDVVCRVVVMTDGRRPAVTDRCLRALRSRGGAPFEIIKTPGLGHAADLWWLLALCDGAEDLLVLEDDIIPCKNAVKYMKAFHLHSSTALTSFFDMRHLVGMYPQVLRTRPEAHDGLGMMGTQAFKVSARWRREFTIRSPMHQSGDIALFRALGRSIDWIAMHAPSLVQHDDPRQTLNFVGTTFDADLLTR